MPRVNENDLAHPIYRPGQCPHLRIAPYDQSMEEELHLQHDEMGESQGRPQPIDRNPADLPPRPRIPDGFQQQDREESVRSLLRRAREVCRPPPRNDYHPPAAAGPINPAYIQQQVSEYDIVI